MEFCIYCGIPATTVDHVIPRHILERAESAEIDLGRYWHVRNKVVPACRECNSAIGGKMLTTIKERRECAHRHIRKKYKRLLGMPNWSEEELAEVSEDLKQDILESIKMRDWLRERLRWAGASHVKDLTDLLGVSNDIVLGLARKWRTGNAG